VALAQNSTYHICGNHDRLLAVHKQYPLYAICQLSAVLTLCHAFLQTVVKPYVRAFAFCANPVPDGQFRILASPSLKEGERAHRYTQPLTGPQGRNSRRGIIVGPIASIHQPAESVLAFQKSLALTFYDKNWIRKN
jgi:hypothetical protein